MQAKDPTKIIEIAVKGMLPKNPLGRAMLRKLKVYAGTEHPHTAQQPIEINLDKARSRIDINGSCKKNYYGTGRRKTSTARVFLKPGKGNYD